MRDAASMQLLHRTAERYANLPRDSLNAQELVLDVIEDVLTGDTKCEPTMTLAELAARIRWHVVRHACRYRNAARPGTTKRPRPEEISLEKAPPMVLSVDAPQRLIGEIVHEQPDPADLVAE